MELVHDRDVAETSLEELVTENRIGYDWKDVTKTL